MFLLTHRKGGNRKRTHYPWTNIDQKSLETEFPIANCRPTGDKWQSKTLFLAIFDLRWSIVKSGFDSRLSGVINVISSAVWPVKWNDYIYPTANTNVPSNSALSVSLGRVSISLTHIYTEQGVVPTSCP